MLRIYTIGSSTRHLEEFIEILHHYQIHALIDVRSFPTSRCAHFTRANLHQELATAGIEYHYIGKVLGGHRKGGYEHYMNTRYFEEGLNTLEAIVRLKTTVVMCAEKLPWKCHRRFIAQQLEKRGCKVIYLIDKGTVWEPKG